MTTTGEKMTPAGQRVTDERLREMARLLDAGMLFNCTDDQESILRELFARRGSDAATREALGMARGILASEAEQTAYGFGGAVENPHDFHPDEESCSPKELEAHKAACAAWDNGKKTDNDRGCEILEDGAGAAVGFACGGSWGIGSYVFRDPEILARIACLDAAIAALDAVTR